MPTAPEQTAPTRIGEREFIALMAMMMAMQALCIDAMLPALGAIAQDLRVADRTAGNWWWGCSCLPPDSARWCRARWLIAMAGGPC